MANNICSKYFSEGNGTLSSFIDSFVKGKVFLSLKIILDCNFEALKAIKNIVLECGWTGVMILETTALFLFLSAGAIYSMKRDKKRFLISVCFLSIILLIYEANIIMYTPYQFHRIFLCVVTSGTILCIMQFGYIMKIISQLSTICVTMITMAVGGKAQYGLPQQNGAIIDEYAVAEGFRQVMPYNEDKGWENTFASPPYGDGLYLMYAMPSYLCGNCCGEEYLYEAISEHILKSRYIMIKDTDTALAELCNRELQMVYNNNGYYIYKR